MADAVKAAAARQLPSFRLGQKKVFLYVTATQSQIPIEETGEHHKISSQS